MKVKFINQGNNEHLRFSQLDTGDFFRIVGMGQIYLQIHDGYGNAYGVDLETNSLRKISSNTTVELLEQKNTLEIGEKE